MLASPVRDSIFAWIMQELNKEMMGKRIRQIRLDAELKQWELAEMLGTTQSAIHKYERGVVPEPRRLMELTRIGDTSVEWVLTGRHTVNGSETRKRTPNRTLETASRLENIGREERHTLNEALEILETAIDAARTAPSEVADLIDGAERTESLLRKAKHIHMAVQNCLTERAAHKLSDFRLPRENDRYTNQSRETQ